MKDFRSPNKERINDFYEVENKFCDEIKQNTNLQTIYGFAITPKFGQIVRVYKDSATFTFYNDYAHYQERNLSKKEFAKFRELLSKVKIEKQPPIRDKCTDMCGHYEFLKIDKNGGNRISIFSPRFRPPIVLNSIANLFDKWIKSGEFKTRYYLQDQIKETKLLFDDKRFVAKAIWKNDDDFRILTWDKIKTGTKVIRGESS